MKKNNNISLRIYSQYLPSNEITGFTWELKELL